MMILLESKASSKPTHEHIKHITHTHKHIHTHAKNTSLSAAYSELMAKYQGGSRFEKQTS